VTLAILRDWLIW